MECDFCKKIFKNKYSLSTHQKSVKSCLLLQGKNEEDENCFKYSCRFCDKKFSKDYNFERHEISCKVKKEEENG